VFISLQEISLGDFNPDLVNLGSNHNALKRTNNSKMKTEGKLVFDTSQKK